MLSMELNIYSALLGATLGAMFVNHLIIAGILLDFVDYGTENCEK